jgi:hypothetical protein
MYQFLYPEPIVDRVALRTEARHWVETSTLLQACAAGHLESIQAMLAKVWPYVEGFEKAIDQQVARLPLKRLVSHFGQQRIREFFREARLAVREMKEEEGAHAELWRQSAEQLHVVLDGSEPVDGVKHLLKSAWNNDPVQFFCWLAGTEYIAEELAAYLCGSPAFLTHFPGNRWIWADAHLAEHDGASHLEIDEDLARAFHASTDVDEVGRDLSKNIRTCQQLFWVAGEDVLRSCMRPANQAPITRRRVANTAASSKTLSFLSPLSPLALIGSEF